MSILTGSDQRPGIALANIVLDVASSMNDNWELVARQLLPL